MIVFHFNNKADISNWIVVDDVVMGGKSTGNFNINEEGHGQFKGNVSLENNGGFSSVRYQFSPKKVDGFASITIRIKGDGNPFQLRVKTSITDYYAYVFNFDTTTEWINIEIPFNSMYPVFRGKKLNAVNYPGLQMEEIAFLIGNKKATSFTLAIAEIEIK